MIENTSGTRKDVANVPLLGTVIVWSKGGEGRGV